MFEFFQKRIATQYPPVEETDANPFTHIRDAHEAFLKSRSETVIGRNDELEKVKLIITVMFSSDINLCKSANAFSTNLINCRNASSN